MHVLLAPGASAHGGLVLFASGSATVDGVIDPAEWSTATPVDFPARVPAAEGGVVVPARVLVMNDERKLNLAVRVAWTRGYVNSRFAFDRDHDGTPEDGDDHLPVFAGDGIPTLFEDDYRRGCSGGACDVVDAMTRSGAFTSIELAHPLDSADDTRDISVGRGAAIGLVHSLTLTTSAPCAGEGCSAESVIVPAEVGLSPLAQLAVGHAPTPRRVVVGSAVTYTIRISNAGGGTAFDARLSDELPKGARVLRLTTTHGPGRPPALELYSTVQVSPDASSAARSPSPFAARASSSCAVISSS